MPEQHEQDPVETTEPYEAPRADDVEVEALPSVTAAGITPPSR